jgi:hypothetical protein
VVSSPFWLFIVFQESLFIIIYFTCSLEATWYDNAAGAIFVNLSCLPALLNSSCLHKLSCLSDLSSEASCTYVGSLTISGLGFLFLNDLFTYVSICLLLSILSQLE